MNQALKREIELAQYAALKGDAKSFFTHEERIFSMDVHNDAAPIDLLNKLRLIAALRADKFKTATEVWDAMKGEITKQDKIELWNHLLSAPEISDSDYTELIHIIVGDPNQKGSLLTNKMIWAVVILFIVLLGGGIIWETDLFDIKTRISNRFFEEGSGSENKLFEKVSLSAKKLFEKVSPSVLMFVNVADITLPNGKVIQLPLSHGSGFLIDDQGTVVTNRHVVDVIADEIDLEDKYWDGVVTNITLYALVQEPHPHHVSARVIFKSQDVDLAVVKLDDKHLTPVNLSSKNPEILDDVLVIGYRGTTQETYIYNNSEDFSENVSEFILDDTSALVELMWSPGLIPTPSPGKITSISPREFDSDREGKMVILETNAMISGGNSGGPMFDIHHNVVGMATWVHREDQAVNLCISAETINMILEEWRASQ